MVTLAVSDLRCSYGDVRVLSGVDIEPVAGAPVTAVVGPNAAGKSTLFKCIAGLLRHSGSVLVDSQPTSSMRTAELSRRVAYLPQEVPVHAVLTVFEAVLLARRHAGSWRVSDDDLERVEMTLQSIGIDDLAMRYLNELSGGQRQLVSVAQALVRDAEVMLLDEPTSNLDLQRQLEVLALVRAHAEASGCSVWITLHDLNLASRYADQVVVLNGGAIHAAGRPHEVMTEEMLRQVYGVRAYVTRHDDGIPQVHAIESTRPLFATVPAPATSERDRVHV